MTIHKFNNGHSEYTYNSVSQSQLKGIDSGELIKKKVTKIYLRSMEIVNTPIEIVSMSKLVICLHFT